MKRGFLIVLLVIIFCTTFTVPQVITDAANKSITINAKIDYEELSNKKSIIITVTPDKKGKGNANKKNTMNHTQIWGQYGKGWFLIKDYSNSNNNSSDNQQFIWNLSLLDKDNESYFFDEDGESYRYIGRETEFFKIYVKYKKNFSGNESDSNKVELYKTFYLGDPAQDVQLNTDKELIKYAPVSNDFPIVVTQYEKVELYIDAEKNPESYRVKIIGDNNYERVASMKTVNTGESKQTLEWIPEDCGTFYIDVHDENSKLVLRRKVYVNSENNQYLQLNNLSVSSENSVVYIRLKVNATRPTAYNEEYLQKSMRFAISEPQVWSKTIKNYGDVVRYDESNDSYEINEESEKFEFGWGNYYINATIKAPHSIEPEDGIGKHYRKKGINTDAFKLTYVHNGKLNEDGSYSKKNNEYPQFQFSLDGGLENCEYAFFLSDARGKRLVQDYSDNMQFQFKPSDPGKYKIYARIRQIGTNKNLPNSYEKEVSTEIWIAHPDKPIVLKEIKISGNEWTIENGIATLKGSDAITNINAHMLNVIEINAECEGCNCNKEKSSLMYKVEAVAKGHWYQITRYTAYNSIPFYPRSPGKHRLIIMVKDSASGSWEDQCEILIDVN